MEQHGEPRYVWGDKSKEEMEHEKRIRKSMNCSRCGAPMIIDTWGGWYWVCFNCDYVGKVATDDEVEELERKYKQLSSSKGNPIAGLKLCLARKLDIPWSEVSEIDVQSYIDAAEKLGVK